MKIPNLRYCAPCGVTFHDANPIGGQPINCPTCGKPGPLLVPGPFFRFNLEPKPARAWSVHPVAKLADLWIGFYFDRKRRRLYFLPLPCLGVWIQFPPSNRPARIIAREMAKARKEGEKARRTPGLIELRERETNYILRRRPIGDNGPAPSNRTPPPPPPAPPETWRQRHDRKIREIRTDGARIDREIADTLAALREQPTTPAPPTDSE